MNTNLNFQFHPVGQGLFYSGQIGDFNFVYDCGSDSAGKFLDDAIDKYSLCKKEKKHINLLIISHFHEDHINGLKRLLDKCTIGEVIIPYIPPEERLALSVENYLKSGDTPSLALISFLSDPSAYLREHGFDGTITVMERTYPEVQVDVLDDVADAAPEGWSGQTENRRTSYDDSEMSNKGTLITRNHNRYLVKSKWLFKFFHPKWDNSKVNRFKAILKSNPNCLNLRQAIHNNLKDVKNAYIKAFGSIKLNSTSLVCYHAPVSKNYRFKYHFNHLRFDPCNCPSFCHFVCASPSHIHHHCSPSGQMLTGDAEIMVKDGVFTKHFKNELENVFLFNLPHHGSKYNWKKAF